MGGGHRPINLTVHRHIEMLKNSLPQRLFHCTVFEPSAPNLSQPRCQSPLLGAINNKVTKVNCLIALPCNHPTSWCFDNYDVYPPMMQDTGALNTHDKPGKNQYISLGLQSSVTWSIL